MQDEALAQEILGSVVAGSKEDTTMAPVVNNSIVVYLDSEEGANTSDGVEHEPVVIKADYDRISSEYICKKTVKHI